MAYVLLNENINARIKKYAGLSSETKPTGSVAPKGSTAYEMDTRKMFMCDGTGTANEWHFAFQLPEEEEED